MLAALQERLEQSLLASVSYDLATLDRVMGNSGLVSRARVQYPDELRMDWAQARR